MPLFPFEVRMLRVACPNCAKPLNLPDAAAGKKVKCPHCAQVLRAPGAPVAAQTAAQAKNKAADETAKRIQGELEVATPYELKQDAITVEDMKKSAQAEAVDAMVVDAHRVKKRNKAWESIGMPAKFLKRFALSACVFWLCTYLFLLMVIVLANHTMENADKDGFINTGGVKQKPKYLFIQDVFDISPQIMPPLRFWLIVTAGFIVAIAIYGLQLAGAESMKKLENYRLSMIASVVSALTINLFGIWCIIALMDKNVQYEFRVSKRRNEGKIGDELYIEDDGEEEEEDEEDEDEDEEEEEEEEKRPMKRRR